MDDIKQSFGKFLFPGVLTITGLVLIIIGAAGDQSGLFLFASIGVLVVGIVSLLYVLGKVSKTIHLAVTALMILGSIFMSYSDYAVVKKDIDFVTTKKVVYAKVIQRLKDIRTVQVAHKKLNGSYIATFDSLSTFLNNGTVPIITAIGSVPDTLTEEEAVAMGIVRRDTIYEPVLKNLFLNDKAQEDRKFPFVLDSMKYAPVSGVEFGMNASFINRSGIKTPVFEAKDLAPYDVTDTLKVGSLVEPSVNGNWSGE